MWIQAIAFLSLSCIFNSFAYQPTGRLKIGVVKTLNRPVLKLIEPNSNAIIHLVGVSHGSKSSADLVKAVFEDIRPSAVVLELCDDRFLSISLEAKIRPRSTNETLTQAYDIEMDIINKAEMNMKSGIFGMLDLIVNVFTFALQQGPVGFIFVMLGLLVSSFQGLTRSSTGKPT